MLRRNITGTVVLYEPGFSEFLMQLDAFYSHVRFGEQRGQIKILDDLSRFNGNETTRRQAMEATMTMLIHLSNMNRMIYQSIGSIAGKVEREAKVQLEAEEQEPQADLGPAQAPAERPKPTRESFINTITELLLQDPDATEQEVAAGREKLEGYLTQLADQHEGRTLNGLLIALETALKSNQP